MKESKEISHTDKESKRVKLLTKVIQNPDTYNVNIASRKLEYTTSSCGCQAFFLSLFNPLLMSFCHTPHWNGYRRGAAAD